MELSSVSQRRIVIVGIPGVGKTTVISRTVEKLAKRQVEAKVVNYGTIMLENATKTFGIKERDDMRKLSVDNQRKLQVLAASEISKITNPLVIVDTHLFIKTREGFWPGMPIDVLEAMKPTHLVLIVATPNEIVTRRERDATRARDQSTPDSVLIELDAAKSLLFASALITGSPSLIVSNNESQVDLTADKIVEAVT